ncbi:MAG: porin family protein [Ignavibacteriaceae bacterium]
MKFILYFSLFLIMGTITFSQVDIGVMGGIHSTTHDIMPDPGFEEKVRVESTVGIFANIPMYRSFSLQIQGMYIRKGSDLGITGFNEDIKTSAEYLEFPILARYTFGAAQDVIKPYYFIGPSVGFLLKARQTASFIPKEYEDDVEDDSKSYEISVCVGGGFQILLDKVSLYAQLKYMHGLTNVDDVEEAGDRSESIYSRGISYTLGISLPIGGN